MDVADGRAGSMEEAHLLSAADVLCRFSVTAEGGLSQEQVTDARERYGPNGERGSLPCSGERLCPPPFGRKPMLSKPPQMSMGHLAGPPGLLRRKEQDPALRSPS